MKEKSSSSRPPSVAPVAAPVAVPSVRQLPQQGGHYQHDSQGRLVRHLAPRHTNKPTE